MDTQTDAVYPRAGLNRGHAQAARALGGPPTPRQATEIEALTENYASAARRFNIINDNLEQKLEAFAPWPRDDAGKSPADLDPPTGTLAALRHQGQKLNTEVNRYESLVNRLAEIL